MGEANWGEGEDRGGLGEGGVGEASRGEDGGEVEEDTGGEEGSDEEEEDSVESGLQECISVVEVALTLNMLLAFSACFFLLTFLAAALCAASTFLNNTSFDLTGSGDVTNLTPPK